ncbi:hypothetical protein BV898_19715 [Hypsibius exemplaris]|uniref:Uncharacterized protein n=1 Tax=Hypsibius exemplaris TaxID=2072580 RepID=A0A9X6NRG3_HYPEX|nr:hypothetical protein BV898_19715 [Hypsibius exemplaris]
MKYAAYLVVNSYCAGGNLASHRDVGRDNIYSLIDRLSPARLCLHSSKGKLESAFSLGSSRGGSYTSELMAAAIINPATVVARGRNNAAAMESHGELPAVLRGTF